MSAARPGTGWSRHVTAGSLRTLALLTSGLAAVVALNLLLARLLEADGYGAYTFAVSWVEVLALLAPLGLDRLLTREVAVGVQRGAWGEARALVRASDGVTLAAAMLGAGAVAGVMALLRSSLDPVLFPAFWVAMLIVPVRALIHLRHGVLVGLDRPALGMAPTTTFYPVLLLAVVAVAALVDSSSLTAAWVVALAFGVAVATLAWSAWAAHGARPEPWRRAAAGRPELRGWLSMSLPMMLITALGVLNVRTDVIMVGGIVDARAAGVYGIAAQVAFGVRFGMMAASPALSAVTASLHAAGEGAGLQRAVRAGARVVFAVAAAVFAGLVVVGGPVLGLFGTEFRDGYAAMVILGATTLAMMALGPVETVLMMTGHERVAAVSGGVATAANLVLNAVLIPWLGIEGAAIATGVSGIAWAVLLNRIARRRLGIDTGVIPLGA